MIMSSEEHLQVFLVGDTGVGKSSLANFLVTGKSNFFANGNGDVDADEEEKKQTDKKETDDFEVSQVCLGKVFAVGHGAESMTQSTARGQVHTDEVPQVIDIIDTPGFQDSSGSDKKVFEEFRAFLNQNQQASAIVLCLTGNNPRLSASDQKMFEIIEEVFGGDASKVLAVVVTHWAYHPGAERVRKQHGRTTESFVKSTSTLLKKKQLPCPTEDRWFFIDSCYEADDEKQDELAMEHRKNLLQWATSNPPIKTEFRRRLEEERLEAMAEALAANEIRMAAQLLSHKVLDQLEEAYPHTLKRKPGKRYFQFFGDQARNVVLSVLGWGVFSVSTKVKICFEASDGDGDDTDDKLVKELETSPDLKELTWGSLRNILDRSGVGMRDYDVNVYTKDMFFHERNHVIVRLYLFGLNTLKTIEDVSILTAIQHESNLKKRVEKKWK